MTSNSSAPPEPPADDSPAHSTLRAEPSEEQDRDDGQPSGGSGATSGIPVVGLGGSAGALDSFKRFLEALPADTGAAYVVIQHLAPARTSMLAEILAQHTRMHVCEAQDGMAVEANVVYIIPPDHHVGIRDGLLYLVDPVTEHGIRMPIDYFLRTLAEDRQERAIGILLSGAGSDGTLGIRAIRGAGGLTLAQDQTAQFGEMPRSAVATGLVDRVLAPDEMPRVVTDYLQQSYVRGGEPAAVLDAAGRPGGFDEILDLVRVQTGCDFRYYKKSATLRRIERRMGLRHITDISRYFDLLGEDANEIDQLQKDLLINVTAFFRDAEAFDVLREQAIVPIVKARQADMPIRVWVPGCSSGEEAYSVAMLLLEELDAARPRGAVQVFATDVDDDALHVGRTGIYPESIVADVDASRRSRFFVKTPHGFQVSEALRSAVLFATQNVITDPPFSRMDLVSCRNLLIYLNAATQARLIPLFNFVLKPGGYLFLGKSEGVGGQQDLFTTVSKQARLYRRHAPVRPLTLDTLIVPEQKKTMSTVNPADHKLTAVSYADAIRRALLTHFAASVVLVDPKGKILQFHGQTARYLDMPTSEPALNLLDIAKEGLALPLRSAVHQALSGRVPVVMDRVQIADDASPLLVRVTVVPMAQRGDEYPLLGVIFEDLSRPDVIESTPVGGADGELVKQLEHELRATQQDLMATVDEVKASNEELRIANEEVTSSNEELQSTNEELETSKEELQSVNEELVTVNSQLQDKVERLHQTNRDLANFLESTQIATLFLDGELRIKVFTPATMKLLNVIATDVGRPISDLSMSFIDYDLTADARKVARGARAIEREVRHGDGSSYLVRVTPYHAENNQVDGVVVTFADVTGLKRAEEQVRRLATATTQSNDAVVLFDLEGRVQAWNRGAQQMYGWAEAEAMGMNGRDFVPGDRTAEWLDLSRRLLAGETVASFETQRLTRDGRVLDVWLSATPVLNEAGRAEAFAATERDITERKRAARDLKSLNDTLEMRVAERTAEAESRTAQLRQLTAALASAEQRERQRLTRILHDGLQQILVAAKYKLALVDQSDNVPDATARVGDLIDEAIQTARTLTAELSPPILQRGCLIAGLEWLSRWMRDTQGLTVDLTVVDQIEPPPQHVTVFMFQATRELLFNVIKHADVKTARVELRRRDGEIQVAVEDAGVGFEPGQLNWESGKLKGIGLFSIHEQISVLGGRLEIDSAPGRGSRFKLACPVAETPERAVREVEAAPVVTPSVKKRKATKAGAPKKIRVMVVDDHIVVRRGLSAMLRVEKDMELVGVASSGAEAVTLVQEMRPDVVLMDINMPGMNGIEATRIIHGELPDVSVIGLSMFEEGEQAAAMRGAGAAAYVTKSSGSDAITAAIRACYSGAAQARAD